MPSPCRPEPGGDGVLPAGEAVVLSPLLACLVLRLQLELEREEHTDTNERWG